MSTGIFIDVDNIDYDDKTVLASLGTGKTDGVFQLESAGMKAFVGKVNMDRNSPDYLCEENADIAAGVTENWINACEKYENVKPILTPRFTPSCTDEMFEKLSTLQKKYNLPVQSHLSENLGEIEWVKELCAGVENYGDS